MATKKQLMELNAIPQTMVSKKVNWKQVGLFVALTFTLTWLLDLALYKNGGLTSAAATIALQFQMLLPAFSAMVLGMFIFKDSPIYIKTNQSRSKIFTWYFLAFTVLYAAATTACFVKPSLVTTLSAVMQIPSLIGLLLVIVLRATGGKKTLTNAGMGGGKPILWLLYGLGILGFIGLQTLLNWLFKMGQAADLTALVEQSGMTSSVLMIVLTAQTVILGPFMGLLITFGEEYGWRGYLQPALYALGRVKAILLVGVIWGVWHFPVILMGYNYPGHPVLGCLLMTVFCIGLAFILGYAVLKGRGVWIAAFLHALVNQSFSYFMSLVYVPKDVTYAFGIGLPGLAVMAVLVVLILLDPVWKQKD